MDTFNTGIIRWWRGFRDRYFNKAADPFIKLGITANMMTFASLIFGILAIYFLFSNYGLFFLFALLHVTADLFDGLIARRTKPTKFGALFDHYTDRFIELLILVKIAWYLQDYFAYIVIGIFLLAQAIYSLSKKEAPIFFSRSINLLWLAFNLPVLAYLTTGVVSVYSLALQLQWYLRKIK